MFQLNSSMADKIINRYAAINPVENIDATTQPDHSIYPELARLTRQKQWVLYTANCPRPSHAELIQHQVNYQNIIHMRLSRHLTEEEVVMKAIEAGTVAAIVASSRLNACARAQIQSRAFEKGCEVFFLSESPEPRYHCH